MNAYWRDHPPIHLILLARWSRSRTSPAETQPIEEASQFVPVAKLNGDEWSNLLKKHGLPDE